MLVREPALDKQVIMELEEAYDDVDFGRVMIDKSCDQVVSMMAHNDCTMKDVKREPLSPPISDCSDRDQHTSLGSSPIDTKDEGDQPLDFSMKKGISERVSLSDHSDDSCESELNHRHHGLTNGHSTSYVSDSDISKNSDDQDNSRIGEPQTALLGTLPGTPINAGIVFPGLPPGILPGTPNSHESLGSNFPGSVLTSMDPRKSLMGSNNAKHTRPFKAYPKDPLALPLGGYYGIPGFMPFPMDGQTTATAQALTMTSDELFNQYRTQIMKTQDDTRKRILPSNMNSHSSSNSTGSESTSATSGTNTATSQPAKSSTSNRPSTPTTPGTPTSSRKRGKILPEDQKDQAYWERRRKNNEAAKRSRDARRAKEDEIAIRAAFLEQENLKLRVEVAALKNETAKLRCMLYNS